MIHIIIIFHCRYISQFVVDMCAASASFKQFLSRVSKYIKYFTEHSVDQRLNLRHLLMVDVDIRMYVCMYVCIFEAKYLAN